MATDKTADVALARALRQSIDPASVDVFGKLRYKPLATQALLHAATEDEVLLAGGRGGGKTRALVMEGGTAMRPLSRDQGAGHPAKLSRN